MNLLFYLYRQSWRLLMVATVTGLIGGLSGAALIAVITKVIDGAGELSTLAWIFFGLCLLLLVSTVVSSLALMHLTQTATLHLRIDLSRKLLATPLKKLQSLGKPNLLVILTQDIDAFIQAFQLLPHIFINSITIVACLGYMAWLSWPLFIFISITLLVGVFAYHFAERRPLQHMFVLRERMEKIYQNFRNLTEGSKELQLNAERGTLFIDQVIAPGAQDFKRTFIKVFTGYTWVMNIGTLLFYLVIGIFLFVIPNLITVSAGILTGVTLILLYLIGPISTVINMMPALRGASVALMKVQQLGNELTSTESVQMSTDQFASQAQLKLELKGVCHHYPGDTEDSQFMLGPMDLTIHQGELLFIIGGNGSGKTTLAMLLLGLYQPEAGTIALNGVPVTEANLENYRQYFSAVFSDFHLFEQLLGTDQQALSDRTTHYIKLFGMAHKVKVIDSKFSTIDLSSGQRKRLALVSSYLEDHPIYLFDEWASDQDPVFKRVFYTELLPDLKARGKTVLIITHDDAYFHLADRIIKLEDGHLEEYGTNMSFHSLVQNGYQVITF